jgi:hypothetical protein
MEKVNDSLKTIWNSTKTIKYLDELKFSIKFELKNGTVKAINDDK